MFTNLKNYFNSLVEDYKASLRGEVRVAPRGVTGRVYARKDAAPSSAVKVTATPTATLTLQITRADGTVETVTGIPATVKVS